MSAMTRFAGKDAPLTKQRNQIVLKLPKAVKNIAEAEKALGSLKEHIERFRFAIEREKRKKADPIVRKLNQQIEKGEIVYFEFCRGKHHAVCYKECTWRFGLRKDGDLVCGRHEDFEKCAPIDRVYKLNFNGKPELVYERSRSCGKKLKR